MKTVKMLAIQVDTNRDKCGDQCAFNDHGDSGGHCHLFREHVGMWEPRDRCKQCIHHFGQPDLESMAGPWCPICGNNHIVQARCPHVQSSCGNGHQFHQCVPCKKMVLGPLKKGWPTNKCSCHMAVDQGGE